MVEECSENIDEAKLTRIALFERGNECVCFYSLYCLGCNSLNNLHWDWCLFYYKYMNHNKEIISKYDYVYQAKNY